MAIPIVHDSALGVPSSEPAENCCFCFCRTRYWNTKRDVSVCPDCAKTRKVAEIPLKAVWCEQVEEKFPSIVRIPGWA
jgi:hypothetical protein